MALAKERAVTQKNLQHLGSIQSYSCYGNAYGGSSIQLSDPSLGFLGLESYHKAVLEEGDGTERICSSLKNLVATNHALSDLHDVDGSGEFMLGAINSPNEIQSLLNFKTGTDHWIYSSGSVLSFDQGDQLSHSHPVHPKIGHADDHSIWVDPVDHNNESNQVNSKCGIDSRLIEDMNCFETASGFSPMTNACNDGQHGEAQCGWLYTGALANDGHHGPEELDGCYHKRPFSGGDMPALKQHCGSPQKKSKPKPIPSRDPQSIAAKNRRERISERLKILQDLVPNGTKVDLVTMLEKAISYVKFLQLQVKVLATDEFWPAQGGKAPEVAQVKEAIDAILSSHRDRNSSSK